MIKDSRIDTCSSEEYKMKWQFRYDIINDVIAAIKPKTFVELGTSTGECSEIIARQNPTVKVFTCDIIDRLSPAMKKMFVELGVTFALCASQNYKKQSGISAEVVFQDADHGLDTVMADLEAWKDGTRIFIIDDMISPYDKKEDCPARKAVIGFAAKYNKKVFITDVGAGEAIIVMDSTLNDLITVMVNTTEKVENDFSAVLAAKPPSQKKG
jgi:cephalosporin hydroxylase